LYDVDAVSFDIDGVSYDNLHALAHSTSLIPQEPEIFEQTIRYNLAMGLDIADEQLWKVLDIAAMKETILQLPGGLDTDIKEKGVNLSGGQKQRLALARGLLMAEESDILLLDEPTSSVDSVNEVRIHEALFAAYPEKCIISSIHKLHLLELFDDIYVLNDGQVVERGTLSELQQKQ
jgi:ABC-type multidrug transport system fused ATPase/permease subunit